MLDLIFSQRHDSTMQTLMIVYQPQEDADLWRSSAVPLKGAFEPLSAELMAAFPDAFPDKERCMWLLSMTHFNNMVRHTNQCDMDYPTTL